MVRLASETGSHARSPCFSLLADVSCPLSALSPVIFSVPLVSSISSSTYRTPNQPPFLRDIQSPTPTRPNLLTDTSEKPSDLYPCPPVIKSRSLPVSQSALRTTNSTLPFLDINPSQEIRHLPWLCAEPTRALLLCSWIFIPAGPPASSAKGKYREKSADRLPLLHLSFKPETRFDHSKQSYMRTLLTPIFRNNVEPVELCSQ
jgi:hypothetical protein